MESISTSVCLFTYGYLYKFLNYKSKVKSGIAKWKGKNPPQNAIAKFTAHVSKAMENKMTIMSVFLDLSKVFDIIDHTTLLNF